MMTARKKYLFDICIASEVDGGVEGFDMLVIAL